MGIVFDVVVTLVGKPKALKTVEAGIAVSSFPTTDSVFFAESTVGCGVEPTSSRRAPAGAVEV